MKGDFDEAVSFHVRAVWCATRCPVEHQGGNDEAHQLAVSMNRLIELCEAL